MKKRSLLGIAAAAILPGILTFSLVRADNPNQPGTPCWLYQGDQFSDCPDYQAGETYCIGSANCGDIYAQGPSCTVSLICANWRCDCNTGQPF